MTRRSTRLVACKVLPLDLNPPEIGDVTTRRVLGPWCNASALHLRAVPHEDGLVWTPGTLLWPELATCMAFDAGGTPACEGSAHIKQSLTGCQRFRRCKPGPGDLQPGAMYLLRAPHSRVQLVMARTMSTCMPLRIALVESHQGNPSSWLCSHQPCSLFQMISVLPNVHLQPNGAEAMTGVSGLLVRILQILLLSWSA